jgi:predicted ATPase/DNA-binding SARP family transcriptional activator
MVPLAGRRGGPGIQVRLLGPSEIAFDEVAQPLPGLGERALLALLALSAGQVVAATSLIGQLWSSADLPEDPANALQIRVSKLRRALARMGARDRLLREGAGYRLDVDAAAVDVHVFRSLIDAARCTGDPDRAIGCYDRALALWRGEPLVDFAGQPWTLVDVARLAELRLAAVSERAERMLTLGRYVELIADLEPLVTAEPIRERLVGQLMTALFNAGRQAEALEVYARTRQRLADDLGLDPSRELRTVMEQILHHDSAISPAPSAQPAVVAPSDSAPVQGNLPLRRTSFVGRDGDLGRVLERLVDARLVTLAGPGGAGKTSLAVEAARRASPHFPGGSWLVRLAAVSDPDMLVHTVADALGLSLEGGTVTHRPVDVLIGHLSRRRVLLVMDNCEHVIESVASLIDTILGRCPGVRVLATSREALAVHGEVQLPVTPLPVPPPGTPGPRVPDFAAARLFLDRAVAVRPDPGMDAASLAGVGLICRRLDGIPLALELAAARLASLSTSELAERVVDRFAVLTSGTRTAEARQQTLRATVDWSHDLLTGPEQRLFRRLAIFRGGCTLAAAEAVVGDRELPAVAVLDLLDRLVKQSLLMADAADGHTRYRMLETIRQYAVEKLATAGEAKALAGAHAAYFVRLGEQLETGLRGPGQPRWLAVMRAESANVRAALGWLIDTEGKVDDALILAGSLGLYWHMGRHLEGRETLRRVLALPGGSPHARARALQAVSLVERPRGCLVHPSMQCAAAAHDSLEIFEKMGDRPRAAFSRLLLSVEGVADTSRAETRALLEDAERQFAALHDEWGQAVTRFVRMEVLAKRGDEAGLRAVAGDAAARFRGLGDGWGLSAVLYHFGWALSRFGHHGEAVPVLEEAIEVAEGAGVHNTVQWATADLGMALLSLGRVQQASACFARVGSVSDRVGDDAGTVLAAYGEAVLAQRRGDQATARPLFERAYCGFERLGVRLATGLALAGLAACDEQRGDLSSAADGYTALVELGQSAGEIGLVACGLEGLARAAAADEDPTRAVELLARAGWLRRTYDRPPTPEEQVAAERTAAAARTALDEPAYAAAAQRGAAAALDASD